MGALRAGVALLLLLLGACVRLGFYSDNPAADLAVADGPVSDRDPGPRDLAVDVDASPDLAPDAPAPTDLSQPDTGPAAKPWAHGHGGASSEVFFDLAVDGNGNLYVTGFFFGAASFGGSTLTSKGQRDIVLASYNRHGAHRWSKSFGGPGTDSGMGVAVDGLGNVYLTGEFQQTVDFGDGPRTANGYDLFLGSFDAATGKLNWVKTFGGPDIDGGRGVATLPNGTVHVTGRIASALSLGGPVLGNAGGQDVFVAVYAPGGAHLWSKSFGSTSHDLAQAIAVDGQGGVYIAGQFTGTMDPGTPITSHGATDMFAVGLDAKGAHRFSVAIGGIGSDTCYRAAFGGGAFHVTGNIAGTASIGTTSIPGQGGQDLLVASFNSTGGLRWARVVGGTNDQYGQAVAATTKDVWVTGRFKDSVTCAGQTTPAQGGTDVLLVHLDNASGAQVSCNTYGSLGADMGQALEINGAGKPILAGQFSETIFFGPFQLVSHGQSDAFLYSK
jgi:hypothetical protein